MSSKIQKIPKDHYVPQMYLDAFAIEGPGTNMPHIYQYMDDKIVSPRIKDVASEKHFYTVTNKDTGEDLRDLDNLLTDTETNSAPILKKIIENESINLEDSELNHLSILFAFMAVRTPAFINSMKSLSEESVKEMMAVKAMNIENFRSDTKKAGIVLSESELLEQQKFVLGKEYNVDFGKKSKGRFLALSANTAIDLAQWYYERKYWHLLVNKTEKEVFITSDNPISIYQPIFVAKAMNAGLGNGTLIIPISPKLALLLRDRPLRSQKISLNKYFVDKINFNTIRFSNDYIFSNIERCRIRNKYKITNRKTFQKTIVKRHKSAPFIFMGPPPVPDELFRQ